LSTRDARSVRVPSLTSRPSGDRVASGAGGVVVVVVVGGAVVVGAVVGGAVLGGADGAGAGAPPPPPAAGGAAAPAAKVTGTRMSWDRSLLRLWSLRVTTAQRTWRQSTVGLMTGLTRNVVSNEPPGP